MQKVHGDREAISEEFPTDLPLPNILDMFKGGISTKSERRHVKVKSIDYIQTYRLHLKIVLVIISIQLDSTFS